MDSPQLDAYRDQADRFIAELDEEYYRHFAGLKETLELEPIYERHAELTTTEKAREIGEAVDGDSRVRELWRFACEGHMGELTRTFEEKLAELEATLAVELDGERIPYRNVRPAIANEPDRSRRQRLEEARCRLLDEELNPVHAEALAAVHGSVPALGGTSYVELYRGFGFPLNETADQCRAFLDQTQKLYEESVDRLFRRRLGIGLDEARPWDVPRLYRAVEWDEFFPSNAMVPALEATLDGLGIDLRAQQNIHLDIEDRPLKRPRAFCSPIEVPDRVMLVIKPMGGPDDWHGLFHEAGHAEHFAHTSAGLTMEAKRLGDNAVTEGWAMLLEYLVDEPAWHAQRLNMPRAEQFAEEGAAHLLYIVRRYCAKLLYELELHELEDYAPARSRYAELLGDALRIEPMSANYLDDVDDGFYASSYLRAWAFEAQLRGYLLERFGTDWFARRDAGSLLRELWSEGQGWTADELLGEVAGTSIELSAIADRAGEHVRLT